MIFNVVKMQVKPDVAERFIELVTPFTEATRAEPGNLWFEWARSVDDPNEFVLLEAFRDEDAGRAHVASEHFAAATRTLGRAMAATPKIINQTIDRDGWSEVGEGRA